MKIPFVAIGCLLSCLTLTGAEPRWIRMQSNNFEIYSSASEGGTRDTLKQFEQFRAFFTETFGAERKSKPVRIVAFGSQKEYEPYRFNDFAIAYYHAGLERDTIVMSHVGADTLPVAIHEYVHLVARHAGMELPPWLNEGLAEVYSTFHPTTDKIAVGDIIPGRHHALLTDKWVPLSVILSADRDSPYYNEKDKAGSLYNEGWALTHMLMLNQEYRPNFSRALARIQKGEASADALASVYGRSITALDKELQAYLRGDRFSRALFSVKLEKVRQELTPEPARAFDVGLVLTELANHPGTERATEQKLKDLAVEDPKRPEPFVQLGYLAWQQGKNVEAEYYFGKAYELGSRSPRMQFDYGRMIAIKQSQKAVKIFTDLLTLDSDRLDVRIELANALIDAKQPEEALRNLAGVTKVSSELAPRLFLTIAYAALNSGDTERSQAALQRFLAVAKTPEELEQGKRLQDYFRQTSERASPPR